MSLRRLGDHAWMQYSKCGRTYVLYSVQKLFCWSLLSFCVSFPALIWLCLLQLHTAWSVWDPWKLILPNLFHLQLPVVQLPILYHSGSIPVLIMPDVHHIAILCIETEQPYISDQFPTSPNLVAVLLHPRVLLQFSIFLYRLQSQLRYKKGWRRSDENVLLWRLWKPEKEIGPGKHGQRSWTTMWMTRRNNLSRSFFKIFAKIFANQHPVFIISFHLLEIPPLPLG